APTRAAPRGVDAAAARPERAAGAAAAAAPRRTASPETTQARRMPGFVRDTATSCGTVQCAGVPPRGLEIDDATCYDNNELRRHSASGAAKSGAVSGSTSADPDLARVIAAWPKLQAPIRAAVMALVHAGWPAAEVDGLK